MQYRVSWEVKDNDLGLKTLSFERRKLEENFRLWGRAWLQFLIASGSNDDRFRHGE